MKKGFLTGLLVFAFFVIVFAAATNYDRLVLGSGNYGTDPNPTADITLQNDEYITNSTDGQISFGAANLLTTGTLGAGATTISSLTLGAVSNTEFGYLDGVTSAIQTQLNAKAPLLNPTFTNIVNISDSLNVTGVTTATGGIVLGAALTGSAFTRGTDAFTTTATADTVAITGASVNDIYVISYKTAVTAAEAPLSVVSTATGFIATRPAGTTSGASYAWMRQR